MRPPQCARRPAPTLPLRAPEARPACFSLLSLFSLYRPPPAPAPRARRAGGCSLLPPSRAPLLLAPKNTQPLGQARLVLLMCLPPSCERPGASFAAPRPRFVAASVTGLARTAGTRLCPNIYHPPMRTVTRLLACLIPDTKTFAPRRRLLARVSHQARVLPPRAGRDARHLQPNASEPRAGRTRRGARMPPPRVERRPSPQARRRRPRCAPVFRGRAAGVLRAGPGRAGSLPLRSAAPPPGGRGRGPLSCAPSAGSRPGPSVVTACLRITQHALAFAELLILQWPAQGGFEPRVAGS